MLDLAWLRVSKTEQSDIPLALTHPEWREVDIYILPMALGQSVDLVHHAKMWMRLALALKPLPSSLMDRTSGKLVKVLH